MLNTKLSNDYKIEVGIYGADCTQNTNKIINFFAKPSDWTEIVGVIATAMHNPYAYSCDLMTWVNEDGNSCTGVITNPSASTHIQIAYLVFGY